MAERDQMLDEPLRTALAVADHRVGLDPANRAVDEDVRNAEADQTLKVGL